MKKLLLVSLSVLSLLTLTGCDLFKKKEDKKEETKIEEKNENKKENKKEEEKNSGLYTIKTKLNNKDIEIKLNVENVILNPDLNFVSININNENIVKFELDIPYNEETTFFEDFETQIIKGKDKEYLAIIFDYGKIDGLSAHKVYIVSEDKLIASFYDEENLALKLSGNGSDKYEKDEYGKNNKFYKIDTDKIYYLQPHDKNHGEYVDKVDLDEYVLTIENDKITTKKTGNTYVGTDLDGGDSEFVVIE